MKSKWKILLALGVVLAGSTLAGCGQNQGQDGSAPKEQVKEQEAPQSDEASKAASVTVGGWEITAQESVQNSSLENVSVNLGYTGVETSDFKQEAGEGNTYCLVKMTMDKKDATEDIKWADFILKDGEGNEYNRMNDSFLTELGMARMSSSDLNFGENEGWIAFEIKEDAKDLSLFYQFKDEAYEVGITPADSVSQEKAAESEDVITQTATFLEQTKIDESLAKESEAGHSFAEPKVIVDPYGVSPLTAVAVFTTEEETKVAVSVKGKAAEDDINGTLPAGKNHVIPIYGLYNGEATKVVLTLDDGTSTELSVTTEKVEVNTGEISVEMKNQSVYDYSQLNFICSTAGALYALDSKGDIRWYYTDGGTMGVHQLSNGHLMVPSSYTLRNMYYKAGLKEIDLSGKTYNEYAIPGGQHHDFYEMENGNLLVAGDSQDFSTVEDYIVEIDPKSGKVVWELDMADLLDTEDGASASNLKDGGEEIDWFHNNGVWYDEATDRILLSARHMDAIVAVNRTEKSLAWILGDPTGWESVDESYFFTPVGEEFEWQYAQHQVTMLDNGDIMMFDNGSAKVKAINDADRVTGDEIYSRAVIYRINTEDMTIQQVFQYGKELGPQWYSDWISGVVSLDGTENNLWITAGSNLYSPEEDRYDYYPSNMFTPGLIKTSHINQIVNKELAYEIKISGDNYSALTYRSLRLPLYTEGASLDIVPKGILKGSFGETKRAEADIDLEAAKDLDVSGWNFKLDEKKFSLTGSYETDTKSEELKEGYLVLADEDETRAYSIAQVGTDGEEKTSVNVTGWTSVDGLEGGSYSIYLVLDKETYKTGRQVEFSADYIQYDEDNKAYYGYYGKVASVETGATETTLISESDESTKSIETTIEREQSLVADSIVIDQEIQTEAESGKYTWENPLILTNPYKISPLTAMIVFDTEESCKVRVTVKGKEEANDISGEIDEAATHRIPVVGLYADTENKVVLELLDENGAVTDTQEVKIQTDPLSEFFKDMVKTEKSSGESAFGLTMMSGQGTQYPYAIDAAGDIRWYVQRKVGNYGAYALSNNRLMFQDRDGNTPAVRAPFYTDMYEMDYLGRAYRLYYVANGIHHEIIEKEPGGNLLVLSSSLEGHEEEYIVELDRATGEVVKALNLVESFDESLAKKVDWAHLNTVSYEAEDNSLILSPRNIHSAIKIDWDTNELVWILSNPDIWAGTPYEEYVLQPEGEFNWHYQQHSVYRIPEDLDGNPDTIEISMFDNHCDDISPTESFDGLGESYSKVYSVNEETKTVNLLKEFPCLQSDVTANTIYDSESNRIFSMSSQLREPVDGREGMIYEHDYDTGEVINQYSTKKTFYRAIELKVDWNDLAQPFETAENYIGGVLRPLAETDQEIEKPKKVLNTDEVSFKMKGSVLYVANDYKTVSQVIFKGKEHTYIFDDTKNLLRSENYLLYKSNSVLPISDMASDDYEVWVMYRNTLYDTGETISK